MVYKKYGLIQLLIASTFALGCIPRINHAGKNESIDKVTYSKKIDGKQVQYGKMSKLNSRGILFPFDIVDKKMVIQYQDGTSLNLYDLDDDGEVDLAYKNSIKMSRKKAQEIWDYMKSHIDNSKD